MNNFTNTIFKDFFINEFRTTNKKEYTKKELDILFYKIDELYEKYKEEKLIDIAVVDFGDFLYSNFLEITKIVNDTNIIQHYFKLLKEDEEQFVLILETLTKKEENEVYSLVDKIFKIPDEKSMHFVLDEIPKELVIPKEYENEESKEIVKKIIASYITLLLRKEECIINLAVNKEPNIFFIGILIKNKKWYPIKKDFTKAMHLIELKKQGEKMQNNYKYAELKK